MSNKSPARMSRRLTDSRYRRVVAASTLTILLVRTLEGVVSSSVGSRAYHIRRCGILFLVLRIAVAGTFSTSVFDWKQTISWSALRNQRIGAGGFICA